MELKKQEELLNQIKGLVNEGNETLKGQFTTLVDEVKNANAEELKALGDQISALEVEAKKAAKVAKNTKAATFAEALNSAVAENLDKIKAVGTGDDQRGFRMTVKAAADITSGNISGGDIPQAFRSVGINDIPQRPTSLLAAIPKMSMTEDKYEWAYLANEDGAAGYTAEGATKNQIDVDWLVGSEEVQKITAFIKVTDEMLAKGSIVSQVIQRKLVDKVVQAVEDEVFNGANLTSITSVASAFSAATLGAPAPTAPNEVDVLSVAMTQIKKAQKMGATPNLIFMNPSDVLRMKMTKLTDEDYINRVLSVAGSLTLDGVQIIESLVIPQGDYLIGDFSKALLVNREGVNIEFGYDGNDFTKNFRTVRCEWRGLLAIEHNDRSCFVAGTFATDIAALAALA